MAKLVLTADAGLVDGKIAYATTDKDGGLTALDNDAVTTLLGWNLTANGKADADYWQAVLGFDILSNLNLSANYGNLEYITSSTTDVEEEEVYAQLLYKMSKNLSTYVRYGTYTKETTTQGGGTTDNQDDTRGRLQVEYTF
jgi:predicted porin